MDKWDKRFIELASVIAGWSSCYKENRQIGAVIVKNKRILTTGYNGAPAGIHNCKERGECLRQKLGIPSGKQQEICYAIHAEQNAIISASRQELQGSTLYLVGYDPRTKKWIEAKPCNMCDRMIRNAGILRVVRREIDE